jgi:hypothetical protein
VDGGGQIRTVIVSAAITAVPTIIVNSGGALTESAAGKSLTFATNANLVNNGTVTLAETTNAAAIVLSGTGVYSGTGRLTSFCESAAGGAWDAVATWTTANGACNVKSAVATGVPIPGAGSAVSIGAHAITAPVSVGPFSIASLVFTGTTGTLDFTGKTLNISGNVTTTGGAITVGTGGVIDVTGTVTGVATGTITTGTNGTLKVTGAFTPVATVNATGGTIQIGGDLDDSANKLLTASLANSLLKLANDDHTITSATAGKTFPAVDVSAFTGPTTSPAVSSKTVTFLGAVDTTISNLVLPTAGLTAKEVKFAVPTNQTLTISATSVSTMTCAGAAATTPAIVLGGSGTTGATYTCTIAASTTATSAPIFSTKEKAKVFVEEVNN